MMKPTRDAPQTTREIAPVAGSGLSGSSTLDRRVGEVLAEKYLLLRPLGVGGMGQVWVARNLATHAEVAAKVLLPERAVVGDALERFRREAQTMASLWHRGIVRAFDLVELDKEKGSLLLVMELLHGQTLALRLEQAGRLSTSETLRVLLPILSALDHAHRIGVVHRDLKPDNVFLTVEPDGEIIPKLVDFGISKMRHASAVITARGALVGTPYYMSPEQARGDVVDGRSDIFAVGILLYECLSGTTPFGGQTLHDVVRAVLEAEPARLLNVSPELYAVIQRALAKRPDDRYATAAELAEALVAVLPEAAQIPVPSSNAPGPPSMTSVPPAVSRTTTGRAPTRSRGALFVFGVVAAAALFLGIGIGSLRRAIDEAGAKRKPESLSSDGVARAPRAQSSERALGGPKQIALQREVVLAPPAEAPASRAPTHHHRGPLPPRPQSPNVPEEPSPAPRPPRDPSRDPGF